MVAGKMVACGVALLLLGLTPRGCVNDHTLLKQVHEYFPRATLYKFDPRVLWIQTQVDGISGKFANETFQRFLEEAQRGALEKSYGIVDFSGAMARDGYVYLVLGFRQGVVIWDRRSGTNGPRWILNWQEARQWFIQYFGYFPKDDQIEVVRQ